MQSGDYLLIQFGHSDEKDDPARHTEPGSTYEAYLTRYIDGARQAGATPVLLTSTIAGNSTIPDRLCWD